MSFAALQAESLPTKVGCAIVQNVGKLKFNEDSGYYSFPLALQVEGGGAREERYSFTLKPEYLHDDPKTLDSTGRFLYRKFIHNADPRKPAALQACLNGTFEAFGEEVTAAIEGQDDADAIETFRSKLADALVGERVGVKLSQASDRIVNEDGTKSYIKKEYYEVASFFAPDAKLIEYYEKADERDAANNPDARKFITLWEAGDCPLL